MIWFISCCWHHDRCLQHNMFCVSHIRPQYSQSFSDGKYGDLILPIPLNWNSHWSVRVHALADVQFMTIIYLSYDLEISWHDII